MVKGNATVGEWLRSPIVYRGDTAVRDDLLALAEDVVDQNALRKHYVHVARNNLALLAASGVTKKFFYALRPAVTLRWMRLRETTAAPPMDLPTLAAEAELPEGLRALVDELIRRKSHTRELGSVVVQDALLDFVETELRTAEAMLPDSRPPGSGEARERAWTLAEEAFRGLIGEPADAVVAG
jgi:predicted nucleotidyltransferase